MSPSSSRIVVVALVALSGCATVQGLTRVRTGGGAAAPLQSPSSPAGGGATTAAAGGGDDASVAAAYAKFSYESCKDFDCVARFQKAAGVVDASDRGGYIIRFNPRASGANPDPAWLPGWTGLPTSNRANDADVVYQALVLASAAKTWQARCHADYAKLHATLVAADQKMKEAIDRANAMPNPYDRRAALLALRPQTAIDRLDFEGALANVVGGRHALELAILDAFRSAGRDEVYVALGFAPPEAIVKRGRPRADAAVERDNYCSAALKGESTTTPAPAMWGSSYLDKGAPAVKPPVDAAAVAQFATERTKLYADNATKFAPPAGTPTFNGVETETGAARGLAHVVTHSAVTTTKRAGADLVVSLQGVAETTVPYNCKRAGYYNNGDKAYDCAQRKVVYDHFVTVTLHDIPDGVTIPAGTRLDFFGKQTSMVSKKLVSRADLEKGRDDIAFDAVYFVGTR